MSPLRTTSQSYTPRFPARNIRDPDLGGARETVIPTSDSAEQTPAHPRPGRKPVLPGRICISKRRESREVPACNEQTPDCRHLPEEGKSSVFARRPQSRGREIESSGLRIPRILTDPLGFNEATKTRSDKIVRAGYRLTARRQAAGLTPTIRVNTRVMWL